MGRGGGRERGLLSGCGHAGQGEGGGGKEVYAGTGEGWRGQINYLRVPEHTGTFVTGELTRFCVNKSEVGLYIPKTF